MKLVLEVLNHSIDYLQKKKVKDARKEAEELIGEALGLGRMGVYLSFDKPLTDAELDKCREWLKRRGQGEPIQYISGNHRFLSCDVTLTRDVIIPRQETEILADKIIRTLTNRSLQGKTLWDVCCGSGCIGISIKKALPHIHVVMSDLSAKALEVAKENAKRNHVDIEFLEGDLLEPFANQKTDFFVCNPPYIAESEKETLDREVRDYEPHSALFSGKTGLEFYVRLAEQLPNFLHPQALVWLEMGAGQGNEMLKIFASPKWKSRKVEQDWAGHDRFFLLEIE